MKLSIFFILVSFLSYSQNFSLPDIINKSKRSIIPIFARDSIKQKKIKQGTGVLIGDKKSDKVFILTCAHTLLNKDINDSSGIKLYKSIFGNFNLSNNSTIPLPLKVIYINEKIDLALLEYSVKHLLETKPLPKINLLIMPFDMLEGSSNLKEGEPLLYIGYPMSFGVGYKNYPVSRKGIVAQNIKESSTFLMDGFVQGGSSGSPVFRIKKNKYSLIGIAQAFPYNKREIIKINPGFTLVRKMDVIKNVLIKNFGFSLE